MPETATKKAPSNPKASKDARAVKAATPKVAAKKAAPKAIKDDFAVIETGGKQYIVSVGDTLEVELMAEHNDGDKIEFDRVLMSDNGKDATIGTPYIKGAKVKATYNGVKKGKKISILRYKAKSNRDRKLGHRQKRVEVTIDSI